MEMSFQIWVRGFGGLGGLSVRPWQCGSVKGIKIPFGCFWDTLFTDGLFRGIWQGTTTV